LRRFFLFSFPSQKYHENHNATDNEQCANDTAYTLTCQGDGSHVAIGLTYARYLVFYVPIKPPMRALFTDDGTVPVDVFECCGLMERIELDRKLQSELVSP